MAATPRIARAKSNIAFLERLIRHPAVGERIDTGYLDRHLDEFLSPATLDPALVLAATVVHLLTQEHAADCNAAHTPDPLPMGLCGRLAAWAMPATVGWPSCTVSNASNHWRKAMRATTRSHGMRVSILLAGARLDGETLNLRIDGNMHRFRSTLHADNVLVHDGLQRLRLQVESVYRPLWKLPVHPNTR